MRSFWDKTAWLYDIYETANRTANRGIEEQTAENIRAGDKVLDCAAGTGMLTLAAAYRAEQVVCTDVSREMLIRAMKKARRRGLFNIRFSRRDICALGDRDGKYDRVMAGNVIHLIPDPEKAFAELLRVIKKGGTLLLPTYVTGEKVISKLAARALKLMGFAPEREFTFEEYKFFIGDMTEKFGCRRWSVNIIPGLVPAAYAVIQK